MKDESDEMIRDGMERSDIEYLDSIADIATDIRPFDETAAGALGCPDPDRYADEEDWPLELGEGKSP